MSSNHFFIVGAQRSATTYLYKLLDSHPEIEMAKPMWPEPKFFINNQSYAKGIKFYKKKYFKNKAKIKGEKSTSYIEYNKAARRIAKSFPKAKILILLRDPVERAISNYWFTHQFGLEPLSISEAFLQEEKRRNNYDHQKISASPYAYLKRGHYIDNIEIYDKYFKPNQIHIMLLEELSGSPKELSKLYRFLDVKADFKPPELNSKIRVGEKGETVITPKLRNYLHDHFKDSNQKLSNRLGKDLKNIWQTISPPIAFNVPALVGKEIEYTRQAIESGRIDGDGPFSEKCHLLLEKSLKIPKVLLTPSCTHALEMAAFLINIKPGDEVILPSFTFVSTANAFVNRGAKPIFADIRPDTLNLDEKLLEKLITKKTKAIIPVHYAGVGCEMDKIMSLAKRYKLRVVEDTAQGLFGKYKGKFLGTFGDLAATSFHQTKNFTCGEGGALFINNKEFLERAEIIREKGTDRSQFFRGMVDKYTWVDLGSSYLISDLLAAFLLAQLEKKDEVQKIRANLWKRYFKYLKTWAKKNGVKLPTVPKHCQQSCHLFYMILPTQKARDKLILYLKNKGIQSVFHFLPLHSSVMGKKFRTSAKNCQQTDLISRRLIRLPFYNDLGQASQNRIIDTILGFEL
ncbi:dTDP-4-amino-4,6-dideoxygalactose transaminase [Patescibacteria group bacterium]